MKKIIPFVTLLGIVACFFWKVVIFGKVPVPGDFVVGIYHPWVDYKWEGFPARVPIKNLATNDVASYIYPIQSYTVDILRERKLPLWNSAILGGTPLLANFQSAPFAITNFLYFIFDKATAWSIQIILQHLFAAIFTYLLLRHWKVSKTGSVFGAVSFAFSGFMVIWSQWKGLPLSAVFIPLVILMVDEFLEKMKFRFGVGITMALFLQILSGYPQLVIYTLLTIGILWAVKICKKKNWLFLTISLTIFVMLALGLASFQILPGIELLSLSQRVVEKTTSDWAFLPWIKIITFIAPDFFGNPATQNYWSSWDFFSNVGFVGVVSFTISLIFIIVPERFGKGREKAFLLIVLIISLFLSLPTPLPIWLWKSNILGLNAIAAHRALVLFNLSVALMSGFGMDIIGNPKFKFRFGYVLIPLSVLLVFLVYASKLHNLIALRNLALPTVVFFATSVVLFIGNKFRMLLIPIAILELFYFGWKYTPFSPRNIIFPKLPIFEYLSKQEKPFRMTGGGVVPVDMLLAYRLQTLEGYDAVYPLRMAQFIAALNSGQSDVTPMTRYGVVNKLNSPILDLVNIRYYLVLKPTIRQFDAKRFNVLFEDKSVDVLESKTALPRSFMVFEWDILKDNKDILNRLLSDGFPLDKKIILEADPQIKTSKTLRKSEVVYIKYEDQESVISVNTEQEGMLFTSDSYYPGWKVYVDGKEEKIYRADFAFRAVSVPKGTHEVRFVYRPESFFNGLKISLASAVFLTFLPLLGKKKRESYT